MMHFKKIYILTPIILLVLTVAFFTRSQIWKKSFENTINRKIKSSGWELKLGDVSGLLISTTHFNDVQISDSTGTTIFIEKSSFNISFWTSIFRKPTFDLLNAEDLKVIYGSSKKIPTKIDLTNIFELPFNIKSFFIKGDFPYLIEGKENNVTFLIGGEFAKKEEDVFNCDIFKISVSNKPSFFCDIKNIIIKNTLESISLDNIEGSISSLPVKGKVKFDKKSSVIKSELELVNFSFPDELFERIPLKNKFSSFKGKLNFETDLSYFSGDIVLENNLNLKTHGKFLLSKNKNTWFLKNLQLFGENSELTLNGLLDDGERINCYLNLTNFDLSRWMNNQRKTKLSGLLMMDASIIDYTSLDQIDITVEIIEEKLFDQGEVSMNGQLSYKDSLMATVDPVLLFIGDNYLTIDGKFNFKNNEVNLITDLEKADIELINNFLPVDFSSGFATGKLEINGNIESPASNAELYCEDVQVDEFMLQSIEVSSQIKFIKNSPSGYFDIKTGKGKWRDYSFESGTVNATFENKKTILENCHFKSEDNYFQVSGSADNFENYKIDRLQIAYQNNYLINAKPLSLFFKDSTFKISPFEFHLNDGTLEGVIDGDAISEGHFKMSNFDASILTQFFNDNRFKISGLVFGEVWLKKNNINMDLDIDISLKNGRYMNQDFDEMIISCLLKNEILHIDDISMTKIGGVGFELNGIYPINKRKNGRPTISLSSNFSKLPLKIINSFSPDFFNINGNASGEIKIKGTHQATNYIYNLNIDSTYFDLIKLGNIQSKGSYDGENLHVEMAQAKMNEGEIQASGSVPFDLNIISKKFGQFFDDNLFDLKIEAKMNRLPFLTPYIADLDSAVGDFNISVLLTGNYDNIQRDGTITIENGVLHTLLLSDPIQTINGSAILEMNKMDLSKLSAMLYHPSSNYIKPDLPNIFINGTIDFSQFFSPNYNLSIKAKEASYRLLFLDIYGLSNLDLTVSGRDTIEISGEIESLDANIFYEFSTEEVGSAITEEDIVMSYNLNIPFRSSAFFQNSQIDAEVLGEINLSQKGHQEIDFGGQIIVEDGNVFSYKDNFKELQGVVNFDNKGFNPFIDVSAFTFIDDEKINLRITGGVEDLDIVLDSRSGFSESDILELLTWGKRFEDQEMTSTGFGNQTVSILGSLLENQIEKNLKESKIGMMSYVDDINISGAAGLLQGAEEDFELTAKRKIGSKTYLNLSYKRSFSLNQDQSQIGVEYKLSRHFSVVGNMDREGNLNLKYRYRYAY